ncbi:hypothetical protein RKD23_005155 [Streptomyces sp. SAI-170]|uniref:hypothetical protein n=1 Tax=Streptomyces sp. SAI-170 TaxID=3377729 RepID=UPI003C7CB013
MAGTFGKVAAAAAAAAAVVTLAGGQASAADAAYNTRSVYLDGAPVPSDPPACVSRSIYLAAGNYTWTQILNSSRTPSRDIYLAAGTYTWKDCISAGTGYYLQNSSLTKSGGGTAWLSDPNHLDLSAGTYTMGSLLDPHFM